MLEGCIANNPHMYVRKYGLIKSLTFFSFSTGNLHPPPRNFDRLATTPLTFEILAKPVENNASMYPFFEYLIIDTLTASNSIDYCNTSPIDVRIIQT